MTEPKDSWRTPIDIVREQVDKWDSAGQLPKRELDKNAKEKFSSVLRRIAEAARLEKTAKDPKHWSQQSGVFRSPTGIDGENPVMQEYLRQCARRLAEKEGRLYTGPEPVDVKDVLNLGQDDVNRHVTEKFHEETPHALRRMGLDDLEIELLPDIEMRWKAAVEVELFMKTQPELRFLVLGGPARTGKTIAAANALMTCQEVLKTPNGGVYPAWTMRGRFRKASELSRLGKFGKDNEKQWERLRVVQLLIVDDLGAEAPTEFWLETLGDLLDHRMRGSGKTIITTNLPGKKLREQYGERLVKRLAERGRFVSCETPPEFPVAP